MEVEEGKIKAEFTMGQLDYERWHDILKSLDMISIRAMNGDVDALKPYYTLLKNLYMNWIAVITTEEEKTVLSMLEKARDDINIFLRSIKNKPGMVTGSPYGILDKLNHVHISLMKIKQKTGMGIKTIRHESRETKLKRAIASG